MLGQMIQWTDAPEIGVSETAFEEPFEPETPVGESVILSAQYDDDGNIAVHVRDGGLHAADLADRFVVFRDGTDKQGEVLEPVRSTMGLALTRSLLAANACTLSIDPTAGVGTLFTLTIPAGLIVRREA